MLDCCSPLDIMRRTLAVGLALTVVRLPLFVLLVA